MAFYGHRLALEDSTITLLCHTHFFLLCIYLQYRSTKCFLYIGKRVNSEVVCATHPFADFCLRLPQHYSKVFLSVAFRQQNVVDSVNNLKRQIHPFTDNRIYPLPSLFKYATSFHLQTIKLICHKDKHLF